MSGQAKLYQRLRTKGYPWVVCEIGKNGMPKPHAGAFQFGVRYTLDGERMLETFKALDEAEAARRERDVRLYASKNAVAFPAAATTVPTNRILLADAVEQYLSDKAAEGKDHKTISAYRFALDQFTASCSKKFIDEIGKQDLKNFMGWLRLHAVPNCSNANPGQTYKNKVLYVVIFLKAFGREKLLKKSEYPACTSKIVSAHPDEELAFLYLHAMGDVRFLLDYFLGSAVRNGEAAHAEYSDLKGCVLEIKRKPHLNWHPKKHHCRNIRIPASLAEQIRERQKTATSTLIFPNGDGLPNQHLLRDLQEFAKSIGATFHVELHKLRKTAATRWALAGMPMHGIQKLLGHKNLETTMAYLADIDLTTGQIENTVEAASFKPPVKS